MSWRLSVWDQDTGSMEEFPLRVQGILTAETLPPVTRNNSSDMKRFRPYMRQGVTITGIGSQTFEKCYENIQHIFVAFSNIFPEGTLEEWHGTMFGASQAFETGARYFSRVTATMDRTMSIPFGDLVDPEGILERLVDDTYIHGPDNHVDYIWRIVTKEGAIQYKQISPSNIRIGDIVELSISFVVFRARDKRYKMMPILKGILLLDNKMRTASLIHVQ
ncbi:hypothetical protein CPB84DRAFT_1689515 [Gymnopilus junonius]|uniref:Uncharacterized protein n=1 Tax=Gymnopilus junonius TaxID=109634 RepID=A0A9P5TH62_GYMJU|nr:hypothetical protein CPB84DRAFT_1689515 [Gymnopilus junonius]